MAICYSFLLLYGDGLFAVAAEKGSIVVVCALETIIEQAQTDRRRKG
jgi:hypothetical protein